MSVWWLIGMIFPFFSEAKILPSLDHALTTVAELDTDSSNFAFLKAVRMDNLKIRRATLADKQAVLVVRDDVNDGRDYLPCYYDTFIASKHHKSYVAEIYGEVIAFSAAFTVDEGQTAVTRAARTSAKYSGRGAFKRLNAHALEQSGSNINASVLVDANPAVNKPMFLQYNYLVTCRPFFRYVIKPDAIQLLKDFTPVPKLNVDVLRNYINDDSFRNYLFPGGRIIVDWIPFQLMESNVDLIRETWMDLFIVSNVTKVGTGNVKGVLLLGAKFSRMNTDHYNLDVYGTDIPAFREVIATFLADIVNTPSENIDILMMYESTVDAKPMEDVMKDFGLIHLDWKDPKSGLPYSKQFVFEKMTESPSSSID